MTTADLVLLFAAFLFGRATASSERVVERIETIEYRDLLLPDDVAEPTPYLRTGNRGTR